MHEFCVESISSTPRIRSTRKPSRTRVRNWKRQLLLLCLAKLSRAIRIVGMVHSIKLKQNLCVFWRSDNERSLLSLIERVMNNLTGVELVLTTSPEGDHAANGLAEVGVREIKAQTRILRSQLEQRLGSRIDEKHPLMSWRPRHAANCVSGYKLMDDSRTPDQRRCGNTSNSPVVECVVRMIHDTASLSWRVRTMHLIGWQNTWEQAPGVPATPSPP